MPWAESIAIDALGTVIGVEVRSTQAAAQLRVLWSRCLVKGPPTQQLVAADSLLSLVPAQMNRLVHTLTDRGITTLSGRAVMLHAAGLATEDGSVLVLVAESGTGKTTAAVKLCRQHFGYVTDETVAILESGEVLPFAKPLSIVNDPRVPEVKLHQSPDELGLRTCPDELTVRRIVLLSRHPDPMRPRLSVVDPIDAVAELVLHTSALGQLDRPVQRLLELIDLTGEVLQLDYHEIEDAADLLRSIAPSGAPEQGSATGLSERWIPVAATDSDREQRQSEPGHLHEGNVVDGADFGDYCLLLVESAVVTLGPLGATLWREVRARGQATLPDLVDAAANQHGAHTEAARLVTAAIDSLLAIGVLVGPSGIQHSQPQLPPV